MLRFEVPGNPMGKQRPRVTLRGGYAHAYTPLETVNYERCIKESFLRAAEETDVTNLWEKPLVLSVVAFLSMPRYLVDESVSRL